MVNYNNHTVPGQASQKWITSTKHTFFRHYNNNLSHLSSNDLKTRVMPNEMVLCLFLMK